MSNTDQIICRICDEGRLDTRIMKNTIEYQGVQYKLQAVYSVCDFCGSEQATGDELRVNKQAMIELRKVVHELFAR